MPQKNYAASTVRIVFTMLVVMTLHASYVMGSRHVTQKIYIQELDTSALTQQTQDTQQTQHITKEHITKDVNISPASIKDLTTNKNIKVDVDWGKILTEIINLKKELMDTKKELSKVKEELETLRVQFVNHYHLLNGYTALGASMIPTANTNLLYLHWSTKITDEQKNKMRQTDKPRIDDVK